jgi:hypothetical protein
MPKAAQGVPWFVSGIMAIAFVIGLLSGISASPVVAVILPLLFGLFSVGGAAVALRKAFAASADGGDDTSADVGLIGKQLIGFAGGFLIGMWLGVGVKIRAIAVWPSPENSAPAFSALRPSDMLTLSAAIDIDGRMQAAGVPLRQRIELFQALRSEMQRRSTQEIVERAFDREQEIAKAVLQTAKPPAVKSPLVTTPGPER